MQDKDGSGRRKGDRRVSNEPWDGVERRKHERREVPDRRSEERTDDKTAD